MLFDVHTYPLCRLLNDFFPAKVGTLNRSSFREINSAIKTLEHHDYFTFRHSLNVARLSGILARDLGLNQAEIWNISLGGLFHDYGKKRINSSILNKPGKLTFEEWEIMKKHPQEGTLLLSHNHWAKDLLPIVAYHHERIDGNGYLGLSGHSIPLFAKIVSIADAFDAMTSPRTYQPALSLAQSWEELERNSGTQFEKCLIEPFIDITVKIFEK
ncbi:MAG: HD-GYP domain-containing protein [Bacillota bacterium]